MSTCDYCGEARESSFTLTLEWPAEDADDPGAGVLAVCGECAATVATNLLIDRAVCRQLDDVYAGLHARGEAEA